MQHTIKCFAHLPSGTGIATCRLGEYLTTVTPEGNCKRYLNWYRLCRDLDDQLDQVTGWAREVLRNELEREYIELLRLYYRDLDVKLARRAMRRSGWEQGTWQPDETEESGGRST